jgi:hypothetical protein
MYNSAEYSYENEKHHLTDDDALEQYKKAKTLHPDAIVVLEDLECGHWDVDIYKTPEQKEVFYKNRLTKLFSQWREKVAYR